MSVCVRQVEGTKSLVLGIFSVTICWSESSAMGARAGILMESGKEEYKHNSVTDSLCG